MLIDPKLREEMVREADRLFEDAEFSSIGHYKATTPWRVLYRALGLLSTTASALAATAALRLWDPVAVVLASLVAGATSATVAFLRPHQEADRHQRVGDRYLSIKNRLRRFRNVEVIAAGATERQLLAQLRGLASALDDARSSAPKIPGFAYKRAKTDIERKKTTVHAVDKS